MGTSVGHGWEAISTAGSFWPTNIGFVILYIYLVATCKIAKSENEILIQRCSKRLGDALLSPVTWVRSLFHLQLRFWALTSLKHHDAKMAIHEIPVSCATKKKKESSTKPSLNGQGSA